MTMSLLARVADGDADLLRKLRQDAVPQIEIVGDIVAGDRSLYDGRY